MQIEEGDNVRAHRLLNQHIKHLLLLLLTHPILCLLYDIHSPDHVLLILRGVTIVGGYLGLGRGER